MIFKKRISDSWTDTPHYIHNTSTDTITILPAVIHPTGTTVTVGLKGRTVQSATPAPDNPIVPQGCGDMTKNLFDGVIYEGFYNDNGQLVIDTSHACHTNLIKVDTQTAYTVSNLWQTTPNFAVYEWDANKQWLRRTNRQTPPSNNKITFTLNNDCAYFSLQISSNYDYARLMLNEGSTALPYEPWGIKIPVSSAGQTTLIYLGEVQSVRTVKKKIFDGSENWRLSGGNLYSDAIDTDALVNQVCKCTHFTSSGSAGIYVSVGTNRLKLFSTAFPEGVTNAITMQSWVAQQYNNGTPLVVYYILTTPQTAVVNEPLMEIGDYVDTISNVSIPVTTGGDTLAVDTTVQPSEVTATYKGWHPAIVHERTSGAWI